MSDNKKADELGLEDSGAITTKAMLDEIAALMDAGDYSQARKRIEELRIIFQGRSHGWRLRDTRNGKYLNKSNWDNHANATYDTCKIWSKIGHFKNGIRARMHYVSADHWKHFEVVKPDGTTEPMPKWCFENMTQGRGYRSANLDKLRAIGNPEQS